MYGGIPINAYIRQYVELGYDTLQQFDNCNYLTLEIDLVTFGCIFTEMAYIST